MLTIGNVLFLGLGSRFGGEGEVVFGKRNGRSFLWYFNVSGPEDSIDNHFPKRIVLEISIVVSQCRRERSPAILSLVDPSDNDILIVGVNLEQWLSVDDSGIEVVFIQQVESLPSTADRVFRK